VVVVVVVVGNVKAAVREAGEGRFFSGCEEAGLSGFGGYG